MFRRSLTAAAVGVLIGVAGCGGTPTESVADRIEQKRIDLRQRTAEAEDRLAEIADRLSPRQRESLRLELQKEFQLSERSLDQAATR